MGKKGGWFSAIKRVFIPQSKEKLGNKESDRNSTKKKKEGFHKLRHGEAGLFFPLYRKPSSIEKILVEAERDDELIFRPSTPRELPKSLTLAPPRTPSPKVPCHKINSTGVPAYGAATPKVTPMRTPFTRAASPRVAQKLRKLVLRNRDDSATRIQAAYRGYMARKSFRTLKGLVRLQAFMRGHNVKCQTTNAMKYMQLLVEIQTQLQSRRIQMLEIQGQGQAQLRSNEDEAETSLGKWTMSHASETGRGEEWDDSLLTKEEKEARLHRKVDAMIKRERAMAYAYSHQQLWKAAPKSSQSAFLAKHSRGFPWWWNWMEGHLPPANTPLSQAVKDFQPTQPKPNPAHKQHFGFISIDDIPTSRSSKTTLLTTSRPARTPSPWSGTYAKARADESPYEFPVKDDDSLASCPPFSVPNFMSPTVSAKAKVRASSNPKERLSSAKGGSSEKAGTSLPLLKQGIGSFKWKKGSSFNSNKKPENHKSRTLQSTGILTVDSTASMPATVGRKPFNRFV